MARTFSAGDLGLGQPVVGRDGEHIGSVNEVTENPAVRPGSPDAFYMVLNLGGFAGISLDHLYVPVSAVQEAPNNQPIVLACTADEARERYREKPGSR